MNNQVPSHMIQNSLTLSIAAPPPFGVEGGVPGTAGRGRLLARPPPDTVPTPTVRPHYGFLEVLTVWACCIREGHIHNHTADMDLFQARLERVEMSRFSTFVNRDVVYFIYTVVIWLNMYVLSR